MVKFLDVDPNEIEDIKQTTRGRVSYPLLKTFLETGKYIVQVDRTGMQQSLQGLMMGLRGYIANHHLPIKCFSRKGVLYLMRLDIDANGNPDPSWNAEASTTDDAQPIDAQEIARRFAIERHKAAK